MGKWKNWLANIIDKAEDQWDELKTTVKTKMNLFDPLEILVFNCYATDNQVFVFGRVLEHKKNPAPQADDNWLQNFAIAYRRMNSDEVPDALVQIAFEDKTYEVSTDEEGYFWFEIPRNGAALPTHLEVVLLDAPVPHEKNIRTQAELITPSANAQIAIVSDIDDTILLTGATSLLDMAKTTFFQNAHTRSTFVGVSPLYQALAKGKTEDAQQPVFYVSSSPWNLHDLLTDFIDINHIPAGNLCLRDYGTDENKILMGTHGEHKLMTIYRFLQIYPKLSFVLLGDSGQEDAIIYRTVAKNFPNRVVAIYIRDAKVEAKKEWMQTQMAEAQKDGIEMLWSEHSLDFAQDAFNKNLISAQGLELVKNHKL